MRNLMIILSAALSLATTTSCASSPESGMDLEQLSELMNFASIRCVTGEPLPVFDETLETKTPNSVDAAVRVLASSLNDALIERLPNLDEECLGELRYKLSGWVSQNWLSERNSALNRELVSLGIEHGEYKGSVIAETALAFSQGKVDDVMQHLKEQIEAIKRM